MDDFRFVTASAADMRLLVPSLVALLIRTSLLATVCQADSEEPPCFMVSSASCAEINSNFKCQLSKDQAQIFCCNVTNERELVKFFNRKVLNPDLILGFHMRDSSLEKLEISVFDRLKRLASFSITNSNMTHISGAFDGPSSLTCLNISQNMIIEMHPFILLKLRGLKNIVITNNTNISTLPEFSKELKGFKLDVSGNTQLSCKYLINLMVADVQRTMVFVFNNKNSTTCLPPQTKMFTNSVIYVNMEHLDKVREIFEACPNITDTHKCTCSVHSLDVGEHQVLTYRALVNCSNLSMTSFPTKLPSATRLLDVSHNNIASFEGIGNKTYSTVLELYADNNKIASFKYLEGTTFFNQFQNLSLRNNKIDQIPIYMLSNAFDRMQGTRILLAENKFKCECQTASQTKQIPKIPTCQIYEAICIKKNYIYHLNSETIIKWRPSNQTKKKSWLIANKDHVPDYNEIYTVCEGTKMRVIDLVQKGLCAKQTEWKDYIRYVIYGEILVFVLLIGKVSYDYYIFKTFAYLPWPASKMPKLPCDWCFET